jgi:hypothetical protein
MDNLEKYISKNRQKLDDLEPSQALWERLSADLETDRKKKEVKTVPLKTLWYVAASFTLLCTAMVVFHLQSGKLTQGTEQFAQNETKTDEQLIGELAPELMEAEQYYISKINHKEEQLLEEEKDLENWSPTAIEEIEALSQEYQELKQALLNEQNPDKIVNAMFQNLKTQMKIVNSELQVIKLIKSKNKKENENNI